MSKHDDVETEVRIISDLNYSENPFVYDLYDPRYNRDDMPKHDNCIIVRNRYLVDYDHVVKLRVAQNMAEYLEISTEEQADE